MSKAATQFVLCQLGQEPLSGIVATTRIVSNGERHHPSEVDLGGEIHAAGISYTHASFDVAIKNGTAMAFMVRVLNAAAEKLENESAVIFTDASTVTFTEIADA